MTHGIPHISDIRHDNFIWDIGHVTCTLYMDDSNMNMNMIFEHEHAVQQVDI